tara:strand:- start:8097 stop:8690 length:594 start_codon:yes stop_codon:yes gene_type:complete
MAIFPTTIKPSFTFQKTEKPKVRTTKLGDGFEQRVVFGLPTQQDPNLFNVNFKHITHEEARTIDAFLKSQALLGASFTFTPETESISAKTVSITVANGETVGVIASNNHGIALNDFINITASASTSLVPTGNHLVQTYNNQNEFRIKTNSNSGSTATFNITYSRSGAGQYFCEDWSYTLNNAKTATLNAKFRQVFEP